MITRLKCYLRGHVLFWEQWPEFDIDGVSYAPSCARCRRHWHKVTFVASILVRVEDHQNYVRREILRRTELLQRRWWRA